MRQTFSGNLPLSYCFKIEMTRFSPLLSSTHILGRPKKKIGSGFSPSQLQLKLDGILICKLQASWLVLGRQTRGGICGEDPDPGHNSCRSSSMNSSMLTHLRTGKQPGVQPRMQDQSTNLHMGHSHGNGVQIMWVANFSFRQKKITEKGSLVLEVITSGLKLLSAKMNTVLNTNPH